jgi:hypothetical protein
MMLRIDIHRWFAMVAILNPKCTQIKKSSDLGEIWSEDFFILVAILDSKWPP